MLRLTLLVYFLSFNLNAKEVNRALDYLNTLRSNSGLIKLNPNLQLTKASSSHAHYMVKNQSSGHYEKYRKYFYTGKTPSERVNKAGYSSSVVTENISLNASTEGNAIDNLFAAIYHRFVFLSFDKDEIGFGSSSTNKKKRVKKAYVFNLGLSGLSKLCNDMFVLEEGIYYMKEVCQLKKKMIPQNLFNTSIYEIRKQNTDIVLYPYKNQNNVPTAFYNEHPDPLPKYKVSGFPISVQFNPSVYSNIILSSFKLYTLDGKEIKKTRILHKKNDINQLFSRHEFALMPLARLEYNQTYRVSFEAVADGSVVKKSWVFNTAKTSHKVHRVAQKNESIHVKSGETITLYMVPSNRKDILNGYTTRGNIKVVFIDPNTLRVTLPKEKSSNRINITFSNKKKVSFIVD